MHSDYLETLSRKLNNEGPDESMVENMEETHFLLDLDNRQRLATRVAVDLQTYREVVFAGEGMTLVLMIIGGPTTRLVAYSRKGRKRGVKEERERESKVCHAVVIARLTRIS